MGTPGHSMEEDNGIGNERGSDAYTRMSSLRTSIPRGENVGDA